MKKKILFMVQLPPPVHGASLRNESLLKSQLLNDSFSIRVLSLKFVDSLDEIGGFSIRKFGRLIKVYFAFLGEIVFHRPDVAYFTITPSGGAFLRDSIFAMTLKFFRVKITYHLRGLGVKEASQRGGLVGWIYRFVYRGVNVVCIGHKQMEDLRHLPVGKFMVAPDGLANEVQESDLNGTLSSNRPIRILYLSNLVISKGVYDFLETLARLKKAGLEFRATMVGAPADVTGDQLKKRAAELELTERMTIIPPVFGKEKFSLLLDSDIFFFPTYFELFPGVVIEAMQCAKPILTTRTGCIPEIIDDGENGFLVSPRSVDEMTVKLKMLMENGELRRGLGKQAREKYLQEFTLEKYERRMKEVFDQC